LAIGTYAVLVTEQNNPACAVWGYYTVFGPAGNPSAINSLIVDEQLVVYPNPSNGKFTIENKLASKGSFSLEVYSIAGKKVFEENNIKYQSKTVLNIPALSSGIYILKTFDGANSYTRQISIE
jgi:hypothetical protein